MALGVRAIPFPGLDRVGQRPPEVQFEIEPGAPRPRPKRDTIGGKSELGGEILNHGVSVDGSHNLSPLNTNVANLRASQSILQFKAGTSFDRKDNRFLTLAFLIICFAALRLCVMNFPSHVILVSAQGRLDLTSYLLRKFDCPR
jgi:hypothetical protein